MVPYLPPGTLTETTWDLSGSKYLLRKSFGLMLEKPSATDQEQGHAPMVLEPFRSSLRNESGPETCTLFVP